MDSIKSLFKSIGNLITKAIHNPVPIFAAFFLLAVLLPHPALAAGAVKAGGNLLYSAFYAGKHIVTAAIPVARAGVIGLTNITNATAAGIVAATSSLG